ncbi:hypothetical protein [Flavobacterium branchiicola]|uniref:Uncharacterized protein n=1 Tax=Flavobacterium branchiicola TaxID=1114875 RepID=A0ABV9PAG9_9FLAO|nr:hypothetical protein [Flavobacterium branchiicola]MBS7253177.1 hypothetical protein [Flavobacterium branchiicola]
MIQLKQIKHLSLFKNLNKKIELKFTGWEEPNRGQELLYYSLFINGIDKTEELFSAKNIQCLLNEKIEIEHPTKNFAFIPSTDFYLLNTLDYTKKSLKVYFRENGNTTIDRLVGSFFYHEKHLLINKRSLVLTDLLTLEIKKIKFEFDINIEWAYLINSRQIQVIQSFSNICFIYDLDEEKVIDKKNIADELQFPNIFRWIYRGQDYNTNQVEMELLQKTNNEFTSTYFKIN